MFWRELREEPHTTRGLHGSRDNRLMNSEKETESKQAEKAKLIVYGVMAVFIVTPFLLLFLKHFL